MEHYLLVTNTVTFLCCSVSFEKQLVCLCNYTFLKVLLMSCVCVYEISLLNKYTLGK